MGGFGSNMADTEPACRAGKAPVGNQGHFFAHALARKGRSGRQHFTHARPASGAFVADDNDLALFIGSFLNRFKSVFFAFKHVCGAGELDLIRGHSGDLDDGTQGREIAFQTDNTAGVADRVCDGMDHFAVSLAGDFVQLFAHRSARGCHAIVIHQACFAQFFHHDRYTTGFKQVFGDVIATRFQVHEIRRIAENFANIIKVKFNTSFVCDGRQVQTGIG